MNAREKAFRIFGLMRTEISLLHDSELLKDKIAKKLSLIAVDEIMKAPHENSYIELIPQDAESTDWFWDKFDEYWNQVKHEIEQL